MFDRDPAKLSGAETKNLNRAVKRNVDRFPTDFLFRLTKTESGAFSRSQIATSSYGERGKLSYAFTEQGVAVLSSALKSKRAIQAHIQKY